MDSLGEIKQTFFQECEEQLSDLESGLLLIEDGNYDGETVNAVFRCVHSIKGGAAAFGFNDLVDFVHVFESALDLMRSNALRPSPSVMKILLRCSDVLCDLVRSAREGTTMRADEVATARISLQSLCVEGPSFARGESGSIERPERELDFSPIAISMGMSRSLLKIEERRCSP
jgi:two-component system chemotaxis sensor kinase CheA